MVLTDYRFLEKAITWKFLFNDILGKNVIQVESKCDLDIYPDSSELETSELRLEDIKK